MAIKQGAKRILTVAGRTLPRRTPRVVVLCYHSVHPSKGFSSATPDLFEAQLEWLRQWCAFVPFSEVLAAAGGASGDRPVVSITFDDGYADNYEYALPLLQRFQIPATFFVTVGLVEKDQAVVEHLRFLRSASHDDVRGLDWTQVQELRHAGMEIGSHTYSHPNLARIPHEKVVDELRRSKHLLEDRLAEQITLFAYPFGKPRVNFDEGVMAVLESSGYLLAAAVQFRGVVPSDPPLSIPRFFATRNSIDTLTAKIKGDWDLIGRLQSKAPLWLLRRVSPEDFRFE